MAPAVGQHDAHRGRRAATTSCGGTPLKLQDPEWWPPSVRAVLACSVPREASEQVDDLITSCMAKDPQARPSAVDLVKVVSEMCCGRETMPAHSPAVRHPPGAHHASLPQIGMQL